jgi:alpha-tubulin suppressor-like RCC1 family protein
MLCHDGRFPFSRLLPYIAVLFGITGHVPAQTVTGTPFGCGYNYDDYGNYAGQAIPSLIPQLEMPNATAISAGGGHSLVLLNDGTVIGWGSNTAGESAVPNDLSNVVAIAAGYFHSLTLKSDGTVRAWGDNSTGEINVPPGLSNVIAIAAGGCDCLPNGSQSLALKSDGTVVGLGANPVPVGLSNLVLLQV